MARRFKECLAEGYDFHTVEEIISKCHSKEYQWHQYGSGVVITSIGMNARGEKFLRGHFIFGDMADVLAQSDALDEFGKAEGCTKFIMDGRLGWQRALKEFGWKPTGIIMEKTL